jgi:hypothetical protein
VDIFPRISFLPSDGAKTAIAKLGRTEDVQFSPDDRRLAIAGDLPLKFHPAAFRVSGSCMPGWAG